MKPRDPKTMARPNDVVVKLEKDVVDAARLVAAHRGVTMAEYLSTLLRPLVLRDQAEMAKEILAPKKPKEMGSR